MDVQQTTQPELWPNVVHHYISEFGCPEECWCKFVDVGYYNCWFVTKRTQSSCCIQRSTNFEWTYNNVKRKFIVNLINISPISKFIDKDTRMERVRGIFLLVIDFCNASNYDYSNVSFNGLQLLTNSAARIV